MLPIVPYVHPRPVPNLMHGRGFDYITVDPKRRRIYCAHGGDDSLLIVNADNGDVIGQVKVGPMAGVAVDEATGRVFTGDGDADAVSEVDPKTLKELRRVSVQGHVDAIAYDPELHRVYADEDDGTRMFVIDTRTFKEIATIALPGHKPEYLVIDPKTHDVYQNIATNDEIAVIDPSTLKVARTIATPEIHDNHPLQFDPTNGTLLVGGGGHLSEYTTGGKRLATIALPRVDQCTFDNATAQLACAGSGLYVYQIPPHGAPHLAGSIALSDGVHNVGIDEQTGRFWVTWSSPQGDFIQAFLMQRILK